MGGLKREGLLLCLVGPSGGGKTTLGRLLLEEQRGSLTKNVSLTTRPPRPNEKPGEDYHYVSRGEFEQRVARGEMFEWEEVHGNLYGAARGSIEGAIAGGRDLLLDIDIRGAFKYKRRFPHHALIVFIVPPDAAALAQRIRGRAKTSAEEIARRLQTAAREYRAFLEDAAGERLVDFLLLNDDLGESARRLSAILTAARCRTRLYDRGALSEICRIEAGGEK